MMNDACLGSSDEGFLSILMIPSSIHHLGSLLGLLKNQMIKMFCKLNQYCNKIVIPLGLVAACQFHVIWGLGLLRYEFYFIQKIYYLITLTSSQKVYTKVPKHYLIKRGLFSVICKNGHGFCNSDSKPNYVKGFPFIQKF